MSGERTVVLRLEGWDKRRDELYELGGPAAILEMDHALAYLSTWNMNFPKVTIYFNARELELTACYGGMIDPERRYVIGGIYRGPWPDDHNRGMQEKEPFRWSFHS